MRLLCRRELRLHQHGTCGGDAGDPGVEACAEAASMEGGSSLGGWWDAWVHGRGWWMDDGGERGAARLRRRCGRWGLKDLADWLAGWLWWNSYEESAAAQWFENDDDVTNPSDLPTRWSVSQQVTRRPSSSIRASRQSFAWLDNQQKPTQSHNCERQKLHDFVLALVA